MSAVAELAEFRALLALSARVGADPLLVQAAGGNTSLKHEGLMWVKASGTWLAEADARSIMVPVQLSPLLAALAAGDAAAESAIGFVDAAAGTSGLRPSIETTLHAVLPQRVVVHVHCVATISWAVQEGAEALLSPRLAGLKWRFLPYLRPGLPLAQEIMRAGAADVLVLGNHGLVVASESVEEAARLLGEVGRRLARPPRAAVPPRMESLASLAVPGWRPADEPAVHATATDPVALAAARRGSLYPDHVIYLGPGSMIAEAGETVGAALARRRQAGMAESPLLLVAGAGALTREGASDGEIALARCLADVTRRIPEGAAVTVIGPAAEAELLGWDAEAYRRALEAQRQ